MSKAAEVVPKLAASRSFILGKTAWAESWRDRPTEPVRVGLRRVSAEERVVAHAEAIAHADKVMPADRRSPEDPLWQKAYEIVLVHYVLAFALCNPADVSKPLWPGGPNQGHHFIHEVVEVGNTVVSKCPITSSRFTDLGIERCLDELDILAREDPVTMRKATNADLVRVGAVLADGSFFARLAAANTDETRAVDSHIRMLTGAILDLMERGREAPLSIGG